MSTKELQNILKGLHRAKPIVNEHVRDRVLGLLGKCALKDVDILVKHAENKKKNPSLYEKKMAKIDGIFKTKMASMKGGMLLGLWKSKIEECDEQITTQTNWFKLSKQVMEIARKLDKEFDDRYGSESVLYVDSLGYNQFFYPYKNFPDYEQLYTHQNYRNEDATFYIRNPRKRTSTTKPTYVYVGDWKTIGDDKIFKEFKSIALGESLYEAPKNDHLDLQCLLSVPIVESESIHELNSDSNFNIIKLIRASIRTLNASRVASIMSFMSANANTFGGVLEKVRDYVNLNKDDIRFLLNPTYFNSDKRSNQSTTNLADRMNDNRLLFDCIKERNLILMAAAINISGNARAAVLQALSQNTIPEERLLKLKQNYIEGMFNSITLKAPTKTFEVQKVKNLKRETSNETVLSGKNYFGNPEYYDYQIVTPVYNSENVVKVEKSIKYQIGGDYVIFDW
jgi:hypothetical protein